MNSEETIPKRRRSRDVESLPGCGRHRSFVLDVVHHMSVPSGGGFDAVVVVFFQNSSLFKFSLKFLSSRFHRQHQVAQGRVRWRST